MGRGARRKPARLAEKLFYIRDTLGLSQNQLIAKCGLTGTILREEVSDFERGVREPDLLVLLEYARVAGVYLDAIVDDGLDLPRRLPSSPKHEGIKHRAAAKKSRR